MINQHTSNSLACLILNNSSPYKKLKDASVQSQSPIHSLARIKYQYPGLKKRDSYFDKGNLPLIHSGAKSVNKYGKLALYNILFQQGQNQCKYKRILPLFHLNPEDSSIYHKKPSFFKKKSRRPFSLSEILLNNQDVSERKAKPFRVKNITSPFLSSRSTDKLSLSDKFWVTNGNNICNNIDNNSISNRNYNDNNRNPDMKYALNRSPIDKSIYYRKANCNLSNSCLTYVKKTIYNSNIFLKRNISEKGLQELCSFNSKLFK